jgi:hypothetical protein
LELVSKLWDASQQGCAGVDRSTVTQSLSRSDVGADDSAAHDLKIVRWIDQESTWPLEKVRPTLNYADIIETASALLGWNAEDAMTPVVREGLKRVTNLFKAGGTSSRSSSWAYVARQMIQSSLMARCKIWEFLLNQPDKSIGRSSLQRPVFIVGLNRSGTTFLHRLLSQKHETFLTILGYEMNFDCDESFDPAALASQHEEDPRYIATKSDSFLLYLAEQCAADGITDHFRDPLAEEEDLGLMQLSFLSATWKYMAPLDGREEYSTFLEEVGELEAFQFHREALRVISWQKGFKKDAKGHRWLLKNPLHSGFMDDLFATYPDATIIHCHRDPVPQMTSWVKLLSTFLKAGLCETDEQHHSTNPDELASALASSELPFMASETDRLVEFRSNHPELRGRFIDVHFDDIILKPVKTAESILAALGEQTDAATEKKMEDFVRLAMEQWREDKQKSAPGLTLESCGLSESKVRSAFAKYIDFMPKPSKMKTQKAKLSFALKRLLPFPLGKKSRSKKIK